ncbi:polysaccharide biosynthesis/export family protein [Paracoccus isoporae]|uniref:polysaccharide biosynthesis/export family protein n=1 Tax=Paracoccus isoporae TaxID=591205 RepID=UPI00159FCE03|nr:polysaccharide biosynthesis/export family protein [Paracoccus isoporae]
MRLIGMALALLLSPAAPGAAQPVAGQPEPVRPDPTLPDASQTDTAQTHSSQTDPSQSDSAPTIALQPGDTVALSVMSRDDLSRDYLVAADGTISVHVIGRITAAGLSAAGLESLIETRLAEAFGQPLSVTTEVVSYRPVIVSGAVAAPGRIDFLPDMDAAAAIALAGGVGGGVASDDTAAQMRIEAEATRYATLRVQLADRLMRQARLRAERDGTGMAAVPEQVAELIGPDAAALLAVQTDLRDLRATEQAQRTREAGAKQDLAAEEAGAYGDRQALIRRQLDATLEELDRQQKLSERGLALSERQLALRVSADRYRADELEAVALAAEARQRVADAQNGLNAAQMARRAAIAEELASLASEILQIRSEMRRARQFLAKFGWETVRDLSEPGPRYLIRRRDAAGVTQIPSTSDSLLRPGDHLQVMIGENAGERPE